MDSSLHGQARARNRSGAWAGAWARAWAQAWAQAWARQAWSRSWLFAALLPGILGCASQPERPEQLSKDAVVLSLPLMRQDAMYECGLVSLAVLCEYYQKPIPADVSQALAALAKERKGISGGELTRTLELLGFEAFLFEGTLDRSDTGLYHHVDAGRPLLVMTSEGGDEFHYLLFLGYDEPLGNVCLLDPVRGRVLEAAPVFERAWERCQRFTLLALPSTPPEPSASPSSKKAQP